MTITRFEEILSWQKAQVLALDVYTTFRDVRDYSFNDQIRRAVVSISNNIAEGFERGSDADFIRMLYIAKGSAGEVRSMLYLAQSLGYIPDAIRDDLLSRSNDIARLITALIKSINARGRGNGNPQITKQPGSSC